MDAGSDFAAQFELAQLHGHHDGMSATFAWLGCEWRQVAGDENLRVAAAAGDHPEWFFAHSLAHSNIWALFDKRVRSRSGGGRDLDKCPIRGSNGGVRR